MCIQSVHSYISPGLELFATIFTCMVFFRVPPLMVIQVVFIFEGHFTNFTGKRPFISMSCQVLFEMTLSSFALKLLATFITNECVLNMDQFMSSQVKRILEILLAYFTGVLAQFMS